MATMKTEDGVVYTQEINSSKEGYEVTGHPRFWINLMQNLLEAHDAGADFIYIENTMDLSNGDGPKIYFKLEVSLVDVHQV